MCLDCNRSSIGYGIVICPGCFPQKFGAFFCYNHSRLTCGSLMPFTLHLAMVMQMMIMLMAMVVVMPFTDLWELDAMHPVICGN